MTQPTSYDCGSRRPPRPATTHRRGLFILESLTGITVILLMTGALVYAGFSYLRARDHFMLERTLRMAAQTQLDRHRAGIRPDAPAPEGLLPEYVTVETTTAPGTGPWAGLTKVTVTATGVKRGRTRQIVLSGYLSKGRAK